MKLLSFAFCAARRLIREPAIITHLYSQPRLLISEVIPRRNLFVGRCCSQDTTEEDTQKKIDPAKDRTKVIPVETSIKYLKSKAYRETYGENPVWLMYRRNFKGPYTPNHTRKTCIESNPEERFNKLFGQLQNLPTVIMMCFAFQRQGQITTGNPCPICRDEYLVLHYENVDLLKQFISPFNGETLGYKKTGLCRRKQENLLVEIERAKDRGLITFDVPHREYDYSEFTRKFSKN